MITLHSSYLNYLKSLGIAQAKVKLSNQYAVRVTCHEHFRNGKTTIQYWCWLVGTVNQYARIHQYEIHTDIDNKIMHADYAYFRHSRIPHDRLSMFWFLNTIGVFPKWGRKSSRWSRSQIAKCKSWRCHPMQVERQTPHENYVVVCDCTTSGGAKLCLDHQLELIKRGK